jgi:hypothetical protein
MSTALELQQQQPLSMERRELASDVLAATARAQVQARYIVAKGNPRDIDVVRTRILKACDRPAFASAALYKKPQGNATLTGLSIRFAEEAQRCLGNLMPERTIIYDDETKRIVRISLTDLETNITHSKDLVLNKTVERKSASGREVVGQRTNTNNETVYIVLSTEDELLMKEANTSAKWERTLTLKLLPGDIQDEAKDAIRQTMERADRADPDAAKKKIIDAFDEIGIRANELKTYLGVATLDGMQPADFNSLRDAYAAIRDGEATWRELMEQREKARGADSTTISPAQANQFSHAYKAAGLTLADARAYLADLSKRLGITIATSLQIPQTSFDDAMKWAKTPKSAATGETKPTAAETKAEPAETTKAEPKTEAMSEDEEKAREGFKLLGWDDKVIGRFMQQDAYKGGNWAAAAKEVQRLLDKD